MLLQRVYRCIYLFVRSPLFDVSFYFSYTNSVCPDTSKAELSMEGSGPIWNWDLMHDVFYAEGKVDQLELGWYLYVYIYMYMIYVCMFITDCRQAWLIIFTVDLLLLCECNWFAMFFMLRRLFAMNSCTAVESLDWSLEVHDATYAKLLSIGPNLFFPSCSKKSITMVFMGATEKTPLIWSIPSKCYNHSFPFWERTKLLELLLCEVY